MSIDIAEVQRIGNHRLAERQERLGGDELWDKDKPDDTRGGAGRERIA